MLIILMPELRQILPLLEDLVVDGLDALIYHAAREAHRTIARKLRPYRMVLERILRICMITHLNSAVVDKLIKIKCLL